MGIIPGPVEQDYSYTSIPVVFRLNVNNRQSGSTWHLLRYYLISHLRLGRNILVVSAIATPHFWLSACLFVEYYLIAVDS